MSSPVPGPTAARVLALLFCVASPATLTAQQTPEEAEPPRLGRLGVFLDWQDYHCDRDYFMNFIGLRAFAGRADTLSYD